MANGTQQSPMLNGIKVLDFTQYLAGPTATRLMAELGAEIIKVEQAKGGDPSRTLPFLKDGRSVYFIQQNRGKKSFCVDFSKPEGVELVRALCRMLMWSLKTMVLASWRNAGLIMPHSNRLTHVLSCVPSQRSDVRVRCRTLPVMTISPKHFLESCT